MIGTAILRRAAMLALVAMTGAAVAASGQGGAAPVAASSADPTRYVDPLIGTDKDGHVFPGATLPFGMVQLSPSNDRDGWKWTSGYHYSDTVIDGFAHTHISGAGLSALGDILLMPARSPNTAPGALDRPGSGYRSRFSHAREAAEPGYYRVHLDDPDVDAELTASLRAGFHRYTYRGKGDDYVIIDPVHSVGDYTYKTELEIVSDREIRGYRRAISQSSGDRGAYFVARFSRPFLRAGLTDANAPITTRKATGKAIRAFVQFPAGAGDSVEAAVAISYTGYAGAAANFAAEARGRTFDQVRSAAHDIWRRQLDRITIDEPSVVKKRTFYTALYHAAIAPNLISDVGGAYYVEGKTRASKIPQFSNLSNWDTYRAAQPLLTITNTQDAGRIVASMVSRYRDAGLILPSWEAVGHDNRVMIGYPIVSTIADAVMKDIPGVDPEAAYAAIRASAFDRTKHSNVYDANGMDGYLTYGFVPADVASSVSKTTEQNYEDWAIGRVAAKLGRTADAAMFAERAIGYRQLYDPASGYLLPRYADGRFAAMRRDDWGDLQRHYVSGNIWAYSAYTPHDMIGAIRLHGGRAAYAKWLEGVFTDTAPIGGEQHVDLSGFIGRYGHGDEPGHQMAYLFNLAGQPWRTQFYVNRVIREMYSDRPDGLVNNDDLGQMSAWYVMSTLGFYPVAPGDLTYQIGAPYHRRATIALESGKTFTVEAEELSDRNIYIQSATFDGRPYGSSYLTHAQIMGGGVLRFVMGPTPNKDWGARPADSSLGAFDDRAPAPVARSAPWAPFDADDGARFAGTRTIAFTASDANAVVRYTTDGKRPTIKSPLLRGPITVDRDTLVRAIALYRSGRASTEFARQYYRSVMAGLAPGFPKIAMAGPDMPYGRADGAMLIDQVEGTRFYGDKKWSGRRGDITARIDLGAARPVRSASVGYLDDPMNGIMPPRRIELWGGDTPGTMRLIAARDVAAPRTINQRVVRVSLPGARGAFRYYRIHARSFGDMPATLSAPGRLSWLFLDEILLQ